MISLRSVRAGRGRVQRPGERVLAGVRWASVLTCGALLLPVGCLAVELQDPEAEGTGGTGPSDGADDGENPGDREPVEPGSCNAWKVSYCDAVSRCSFGTRQECEIDVGYVMCREDAPVAECAEAIEEASCGDMPSGCSPTSIADRSLPTEVCQELQTEICEWSLYCGYDFSLEGCQIDLAAAQPCGEFTAVLPGYEECLADYRRLPCDVQVPPSCEGLLRR